MCFKEKEYEISWLTTEQQPKLESNLTTFASSPSPHDNTTSQICEKNEKPVSHTTSPSNPNLNYSSFFIDEKQTPGHFLNNESKHLNVEIPEVTDNSPFLSFPTDPEPTSFVKESEQGYAEKPVSSNLLGIAQENSRLSLNPFYLILRESNGPFNKLRESVSDIFTGHSPTSRSNMIRNPTSDSSCFSDMDPATFSCFDKTKDLHAMFSQSNPLGQKWRKAFQNDYVSIPTENFSPTEDYSQLTSLMFGQKSVPNLLESQSSLSCLGYEYPKVSTMEASDVLSLNELSSPPETTGDAEVSELIKKEFLAGIQTLDRPNGRQIPPCLSSPSLSLPPNQNPVCSLFNQIDTERNRETINTLQETFDNGKTGNSLPCDNNHIVCVWNVPEFWSLAHFHSIFLRFGKLLQYRLEMEYVKGVPVVRGYLKYENPHSAVNACLAMNANVIKNNTTLKVTLEEDTLQGRQWNSFLQKEPRNDTVVPETFHPDDLLTTSEFGENEREKLFLGKKTNRILSFLPKNKLTQEGHSEFLQDMKNFHTTRFSDTYMNCHEKPMFAPESVINNMPEIVTTGNQEPFFSPQFSTSPSSRLGRNHNNFTSNKFQIPTTSEFHKPVNQDILQENNLFVFRIPPEWDEAEFRRIFSQFGPIKSLRFPKDDRTPWGHRGYGFVCYNHREHACLAIQEMHEKEVELGRRLKVEFKKQQNGSFNNGKKQNFHDSVGMKHIVNSLSNGLNLPYTLADR